MSEETSLDGRFVQRLEIYFIPELKAWNLEHSVRRSGEPPGGAYVVDRFSTKKEAVDSAKTFTSVRYVSGLGWCLD